jgi:SNF2 family DNA or RNA helicase
MVDDDDDDSSTFLMDSPNPTFSKPSKKQTKKTLLKPRFDSLASFQDGSDDDDDSLGPAVVKTSSSTTTTTTTRSDNNNDEEEKKEDWMDSPPPKPVARKTLPTKTKKQLNPFSQFANSINNNNNNNFSSLVLQDDSDDVMDEDDDVAMALAMSESMTHNNSNNNKKKKKVVIDIEDDAAEPLAEESSEEEESEEDEEDGYDEEKEAATNVLQTAEALSARVLMTMSQWFSSNGGQDASKGMIIQDGALALGNAAAAAAAAADHSTSSTSTSSTSTSTSTSTGSKEWISQETMTQILPNVKLSNYQLIGVNWLSLLHGMECTIEGKKNRQTNVNGILADEMGLVRYSKSKMFFVSVCWGFSLTLATITGKDGTNHCVLGISKAPAIVERNRSSRGGRRD